MEQTTNGLRLTVPAVGIFRRHDLAWVPAQRMFWIGVVWCALAVLLSAFFFALPTLAAQNTVGGTAATEAAKDFIVPWPIWAGLAGFSIVGLVTLVGGLKQCRRRGIFEVTDRVLRVEQTTLFGRKLREWPRERIAAVQTGPSGFTLGNGSRATGVSPRGGIRVAELHVIFTDGACVRLFAGRSETELTEIAAQLHKSLHVGTADG